jgi:hypothetical protein
MMDEMCGATELVRSLGQPPSPSAARQLPSSARLVPIEETRPREGAGLRVVAVVRHVLANCYVHPAKVVTGSWQDVVHTIGALRVAHYQSAEEAWYRHGDHREFCLMRFNRYPDEDPAGEGVVQTVVLRGRIESEGKFETLDDQDWRMVFLRAVARGAIVRPLSALDRLLQPGPAGMALVSELPDRRSLRGQGG